MSVIRRGVVRCHLALTSASPEPVATIGSPNVTRIPSCAIVSVCNGVECCLGFRKTTNDDLWARSCLIRRAEATGNSRATLPSVTSSDGREVGAHCSRSWKGSLSYGVGISRGQSNAIALRRSCRLRLTSLRDRSAVCRLRNDCICGLPFPPDASCRTPPAP
jgi:hypothetical protein